MRIHGSPHQPRSISASPPHVTLPQAITSRATLHHHHCSSSSHGDVFVACRLQCRDGATVIIVGRTTSVGSPLFRRSRARRSFVDHRSFILSHRRSLSPSVIYFFYSVHPRSFSPVVRRSFVSSSLLVHSSYSVIFLLLMRPRYLFSLSSVLFLRPRGLPVFYSVHAVHPRISSPLPDCARIAVSCSFIYSALSFSHHSSCDFCSVSVCCLILSFYSVAILFILFILFCSVVCADSTPRGFCPRRPLLR